MLRKSRSKRHAKCSIKRYSKHSKTRIIRNMYRKKHKKTQRGGMFGLTSDKTQRELATVASNLQEKLVACKEELATSKKLHDQSHGYYRKEIQDREFFYQSQIQNLEAKLLVYGRKIHDVEVDLTNKLGDMKRAYDGCMDKYDSDTVKYNEAKKKIIEEAGPEDNPEQGYYYDKKEDVEKIVRSYMEHNDLERAVREYKNRPKEISQAFERHPKKPPETWVQQDKHG